MNAQDIRLSVGFPNHPKTIKLERRLGFQGIRSLLSLWTWAAQNRPEGNLGGANDRSTTVQRPLDEEDIEIVAQWPGEPGAFVATLVALGWLDQTAHGYCLHEWQQHNPWVAAATNRGDKARFSRMAKTHPDIYKSLCEQGIREVSADEFARLKAGWPLKGRSTDVGESLNHRSTSVEHPLNDRSTNVEASLTPSPSPSPSPFPSPIELKEQETREPAHVANRTPVAVLENQPGEKRLATAPRTVHAAEPAEPACVETGLTTLDWEPALEASPQVVAPPREETTATVPETPPSAPTTPTKPVITNTPATPTTPITSESPETNRPEANGEPDAGAVHSEGAAAPRKPARRTAAPPTMPTAPDWLPAELWERWRAHRRALKKPLSADGSTLLFAQLAKAKSFGHDPVELLETAIVNGWQGCVFPDKHYQPAARSDRDGVPRHGARRPWPTPPTDPAAYRQTAGFATELEAA